MLSIIIPTLNEEKYLPDLLESIKKQDFKDYEIIVADAGSKDRTIEIAKKYNCRLVPGGMPAKGRNIGAELALGSIFLFIDSGIIMPNDFLKIAVEKFNKLDAGTACFPCYFTGKKIDLFASKVYNFWINITQKFLPHSFEGVIMVKNDIHKAINGFDELIKVADDFDYVIRAKKISKFRFLKTPPLLVSPRRIEKDGRWVTYLKYILIEIHTIFLGPIKTDIIKYKFGHYNDK